MKSDKYLTGDLLLHPEYTLNSFDVKDDYPEFDNFINIPEAYQINKPIRHTFKLIISHELHSKSKKDKR